jgi:hypothetical protein
MKGLLALGATLWVAGCASSSGVYQVSPGTYRITTTAITSYGGKGTATGAAAKTAAAECAKSGKQVHIMDESSDAQFTQASVSLTFRCE